jgi:hypothetical protein
MERYMSFTIVQSNSQLNKNLNKQKPLRFMKKLSLTIAIIIIVLLAIGAYITYFEKKNEVIGGQKDEHGCLGPAGYSYDVQVGACTRNWEINDRGKIEAARTAVNFVGKDYGLAVLNANAGNCSDCFTVEIKKGNDSVIFEIKNNTILSVENAISRE